MLLLVLLLLLLLPLLSQSLVVSLLLLASSLLLSSLCIAVVMVTRIRLPLVATHIGRRQLGVGFEKTTRQRQTYKHTACGKHYDDWMGLLYVFGRYGSLHSNILSPGWANTNDIPTIFRVVTTVFPSSGAPPARNSSRAKYTTHPFAECLF